MLSTEFRRPKDATEWSHENGWGKLRKGDVRVVWSDHDLVDGWPRFVALEDDELNDFFAWANTYLSSLCPISSLMRVFRLDDGPSLRTPSETRSFDGWAALKLGLIIAEAFSSVVATKSGLSPKIASFPLVPCLGTCSYAIARGRCSYNPSNVIAERWQTVHELIGRPVPPVLTQEIVYAWSIIDRLDGRPDVGRVDDMTLAITRICVSLRDHGEVDGKSLASLAEGAPLLRDAFSHMGGALEERVRWAEQALSRTLRRDRDVSTARAFVCALLVSRIAPGSLDHMDMLLPYSVAVPGILLWYGLCTAGARSGRFMAYVGNLGRRLLHGIFAERNVLDRPRCDIALDELRTISNSPSSMRSIRREGSTELIVEIAPCVNTVVRPPLPNDTSRAATGRRMTPRPDEIGIVLKELDRALLRARRGLRRIEKDSH